MMVNADCMLVWHQSDLCHVLLLRMVLVYLRSYPLYLLHGAFRNCRHSYCYSDGTTSYAAFALTRVDLLPLTLGVLGSCHGVWLQLLRWWGHFRRGQPGYLLSRASALSHTLAFC